MKNRAGTGMPKKSPDLLLAHHYSSRLFHRTLQHPVLYPFIEWVPTDWLLGLANPKPSATTDLGNWQSDERVDWEHLFADMLAAGMRDPFMVGVGRVTRRVRLEAGNHRIRLMVQHGIHMVPAVAYVGDSAISYQCVFNGNWWTQPCSRHPARESFPASPRGDCQPTAVCKRHLVA